MEEPPLRYDRREQAPGQQPATYRDIEITVQEIVREDNKALAMASLQIVRALSDLRLTLSEAGVALTPELNRKTLELALKFAGEICSNEDITAMLGVDATGGPN